jgi:hypothetical protein
MTTDSRDPFARAGDVLGRVVIGLIIASLVYAVLPFALPWLYR